MSLKETVQSWEDRYAAVLSSAGALGSGTFFTDDADLLRPAPTTSRVLKPFGPIGPPTPSTTTTSV
jgi:hypothetical protein